MNFVPLTKTYRSGLVSWINYTISTPACCFGWALVYRISEAVGPWFWNFIDRNKTGRHIDTEQNRKVLNFSVNCNVYVGWARKFFAWIRMTLLRRESYKLFTNRLSYTWKWFLWKQLKSSQRRLMSHTLFFRVLVRVQLPTIQFHTEDFSSCFLEQMWDFLSSLCFFFDSLE